LKDLPLLDAMYGSEPSHAEIGLFLPQHRIAGIPMLRAVARAASERRILFAYSSDEERKVDLVTLEDRSGLEGHAQAPEAGSVVVRFLDYLSDEHDVPTTAVEWYRSLVEDFLATLDAD
jgi:hypothetical protein